MEQTLRDQLRNSTLGHRVWATFTLFYLRLGMSARCPYSV